MECERCERLERELLRTREQLRQRVTSYTQWRAMHEAQIQPLIDPIGCDCAGCRRGAGQP